MSGDLEYNRLTEGYSGARCEGRRIVLKREFLASLEEDVEEETDDFSKIPISDPNSLAGKMMLFERTYKNEEDLAQILEKRYRSPDYRKIPKDVVFLLNLAYYRKVEKFFNKRNKKAHLALLQQPHVLTKAALIYSLAECLFDGYLQGIDTSGKTDRAVDPFVALMHRYSIMFKHHPRTNGLYELPGEKIMPRVWYREFMDLMNSEKTLVPEKKIRKLKKNPDLLTKSFLINSLMFKIFKDILDKPKEKGRKKLSVSRKTDKIIRDLVGLVDETYHDYNYATGLKYFFFTMSDNAFMPENVHAEFQLIRKKGGGSSSKKKGKIDRGAHHMSKRKKKAKK